MPFYEGDKANVIPVYENSRYFQGYVAQGFPGYFDSKFDHYLFVADDMLINPVINQENYKQLLQLDAETCFLPGLLPLHKFQDNWPRLSEARQYRVQQDGIEIKDRLPSYEEALSRFKSHGIELELHRYSQRPQAGEIKSTSLIGSAFTKIRRRIGNMWNKNTRFELSYPMVGSYSDLFVVSRGSIRLFCHYCGIFAASNLFAELALPTAMALAAKKITTEGQIPLKGKAFWSERDAEVLSEFDNDLRQLLDRFPSDWLYVHPVKLSKWKYQ